MSRKDLEALLGYLRENSGFYPVEDLRAQIVRAGHTPANADRAIAVFQGRAPRPESSVWGPAWLVAFADLALAFLSYELFSRPCTRMAAFLSVQHLAVRLPCPVMRVLRLVIRIYRPVASVQRLSARVHGLFYPCDSSSYAYSF